MTVSAAAIADTPPSTPPAQAAPSAPPGSQEQRPSPAQGAASDDDFIEFLGTDDVGDAAWWEFLKKAPARGESPPAPPPQDAKQ